MIVIVSYSITNYPMGEIRVSCDPDEDDQFIIARAKKQLKRRFGFVPIGYQSFKIIERK